MDRIVQLDSLGPCCRLGLATRSECALEAADVRTAVDRGINYLNWCGRPDGLSRAVRELGARRESVALAVQLESATAAQAAGELDGMLAQLGTEYVDVVTYYYVEREHEWQTIIGSSGAHEAMLRARAMGKLRLLGVTSHQRPLAARMAQSGLLDLLMIRYNAAHCGAEREIFPITDRLGMPVVAYTGVRWGALMQPTPDDPPGFVPPSAPDCYRFVLGCPSVAIALMAPHNRAELDENLRILDCWEPLPPHEYAALVAHGDRVHRHAGSFP
jgi:predicted aldo/keto reductase-like oxidoreductase